jgi:hypothetical protein
VTKPFFQPERRSDGMWRILRSENGFTVDVCGAETDVVAWAQCVILNRIHGWKS